MSKELCRGCGHPLSRHIRNVENTVVCFTGGEHISDKGVMGLVSVWHCDCEDFISKIKIVWAEIEAYEAERQRQEIEELKNRILNYMDEAERDG